MKNEESVITEFDTKRKDYLAQFANMHPNELETLKAGNLFLEENTNIREHLLVAGVMGDLLCDLLGVSGQDKTDVVSSLIIHDWDKLEEKEFLKNSTTTKTPTYIDLEDFKVKQANKLREMGYSDRVIALTDEVITHEEGGPKSLPEMIVFYVDAMLISSKIVDVPLRFHLTKEGWHGGKNRYDDELSIKNQEYSEKFFQGAPGHGNRPHFDVQLESGNRISIEFLSILKERRADINDSKYQYISGENGDPNKLPYYLEDKLKERILAT